MQFLTLKEIKAVLENVDERDRTMIVVAYWHGLRASEVCNLTGANVADGFVDVKRLKGSLRTRQPYIRHDDPLLDESQALAELAAKVKPRERIFPEVTRFNFRYLFQKAAKKAGLPKHKQHPHCLKHSIAMATIKKAGIENVRQWLGHKSISSTGEYLKVNDETAAEVITAVVGGK